MSKNQPDLFPGLDTTRLTRRIAEKYAEELYGVDWSSFQSIDIDAARILSTTPTIYLDGLLDLSDECAHVLVEGKSWQNLLSLLSLTTISCRCAQILARYRGSLRLGIKELPESCAEALAGLGSGLPRDISTGLDFTRLTSLSEGAAVSLTKFRGEISLNGTVSLSDSTRNQLGKHTKPVYLRGIDSQIGSYQDARTYLQQKKVS